MILGGILTVGVSSLTGKETSNSMFGLSLIAISQIFSGLHMISEEILMSKGHFHPIELVGWEGCWGITALSFLLLIF